MLLAGQTGQGSRLALARGLWWMAGFGLNMAAFEWSSVALHVVPSGSFWRPLLLLTQAGTLAAAFALLHQFGARTLARDSVVAARVSSSVGGLLAALWIFWAVGPSLNLALDFEDWSRSTLVLAGYGLGLPAVALAAYGLRQHTRSLVAPLALPGIWRVLRSAGVSLVAFAPVGCVLLPRARFFPSSRLNAEIFELRTGLPIPLLRGLVGLSLLLAMVRAIEAFRREIARRMDVLEEEKLRMAEREQLGRELHDGTLQAVYAAGLLLRAVEPELAAGGPAKQHLTQSIGLLDRSVSDIRRYIGQLRPKDETRELEAALRDLASAQLLHALVDFVVETDLPDTPSPLGPRATHHVLSIANEALSNVARHSAARHATVSLRVHEGWLLLEVRDDGGGILPAEGLGNGLGNMHERARILGGSLEIRAAERGGTLVSLRVPWSDRGSS